MLLKQLFENRYCMPAGSELFLVISLFKVGPPFYDWIDQIWCDDPLQDYTGKQVNTHNLYAVLLGDKKAVKGGSGKVVDSKPNDRIFIYYSDHGGPGVLGKF